MGIKFGNIDISNIKIANGLTPRLPSAYQEVEYIQSSGTQCIILGNQFKTSYKVVIDLQMTVIGGDYIPLGVHNNDGVNNIKYGIDAYSGNFHINSGGSTWRTTKSEDTNRHTITIDKNTATVDGDNYSVTYTNYTFNQGIGLFCYNEIHLAQYNFKSSNKLYKIDIYDENGIHIHEAIPCYRKSDTVIGLYDIVNNQFYTNAGTGTFTKGGDVVVNAYKDIKKVYLGSTQIRPSGWNPGADTYIYYPFTSDLKDVMGNGNTGTAHGNVTFSSSTGVYVDGENSIYVSGLSNGIANKSGPRTLNVWAKYEALKSNAELLGNSSNSQSNQSMKIEIYSAGTKLGISIANGNANTWGYITADTNWHNYSMTFSGSEYKQYIDGTLLTTITSSTPPNNYPDMYIGNLQYYSARRCKGYVKDYIVENKVRTAEDISDYYNQTKGNYGL